MQNNSNNNEMKEALGWDLENLKKQRYENEKWQECSRRKNED